MEQTVLIDELHFAVRVPADLSDAAVDAVRRTLAAAAFTDRLRLAVEAVVHEFPALASARAAVSR